MTTARYILRTEERGLLDVRALRAALVYGFAEALRHSIETDDYDTYFPEDCIKDLKKNDLLDDAKRNGRVRPCIKSLTGRSLVYYQRGQIDWL